VKLGNVAATSTPLRHRVSLLLAPLLAALTLSLSARAQTHAAKEPVADSPRASSEPIPAGPSVAPNVQAAPSAPQAPAAPSAAPVGAQPPAAPSAASGAQSAPSAATNAQAAPSATQVPVPPAPAAVTTPVSTVPPPSETPTDAPCKTAWLRDGFYLRVLSGMGYMGVRGDGPSGTASVSGLGSSSIIAIGGSLARGFVLAGTMQMAAVTSEFKRGPLANSTATSGRDTFPATNKAMAAFSSFGAVVDWYPLEAAGLHVGLGAGLGFVSIVNQLDDSVLSGTTGEGTLFAGYDWPIARAWALGLAVVATGSTKTALKWTKSGTDSGYQLAPMSIGVSTSILYF
jgi:hypothetical protein